MQRLGISMSNRRSNLVKWLHAISMTGYGCGCYLISDGHSRGYVTDNIRQICIIQHILQLFEALKDVYLIKLAQAQMPRQPS
jgi:hypothetical protein